VTCRKIQIFYCVKAADLVRGQGPAADPHDGAEFPSGETAEQYLLGVGPVADLSHGDCLFDAFSRNSTEKGLGARARNPPMCDYSLEHLVSRPAKVGDKLVTTRFTHALTGGFCAVGKPDVAVCLMPGTEVAFEREMESLSPFWMRPKKLAPRWRASAR
jgi:hypothetical protein